MVMIYKGNDGKIWGADLESSGFISERAQLGDSRVELLVTPPGGLPYAPRRAVRSTFPSTAPPAD